MPQYIGDDECDEFATWENLSYQPDDEANEDEGPGAIQNVVAYLEKIAPHIKWRLNIEGSDDYNVRWECIAVPDSQLREAEWIMERYTKGDDLSKYSPMDQFPDIYMATEEGRVMNPDIQKFYNLCQQLGDIVTKSIHSQQELFPQEESDDDIKNKLESLLEILPQIYLLASKLPCINIKGWEIDWEPAKQYWPEAHLYDYRDCLELGEDLNRFLYLDPPFLGGSIKEGYLSEMVAAIYFELFEPAVADFQSDDLLDVANAIGEWRGGDYSDILTVLPVLDKVLFTIRKKE